MVKKGWIIIVVFIACMPISRNSQAGEKPELELPEIVITATTPDLMKGSKQPLPHLDIISGSGMVSGTVMRSPLGFPEVLDILDAPDLNEPGVKPMPCVGSMFSSLMGPKGRLRAAEVAALKNDWQKVITLLMPIVMDHPDAPEAPRALYFIGRSKQTLGDLSGATNAYERLRREYPDNPLSEYASYTLGWVYLQSNNIDRAMEIIDTFWERYPTSPLIPYARYLKSAALYSSGKYSDAAETLQGIIAGYPLFPYLHRIQFWSAETMYFMGDTNGALQNFSLYIQNNPDDLRVPEALYGRAFCYMDQNQLPQALDDFKSLIEQYPKTPLFVDASFQAGKLSIVLDQPDKAIHFFNLVVQDASASPASIAEARAWIEFKSTHYERAEELFRLAQTNYKTVPQQHEMSFMAAMATFSLKQYDESALLFEKVAAKSDEPLAASAWNNAGLAWYKAGKLEKALDRLQKGLSAEVYIRNRPIFMLYAADIAYRLCLFDQSLKSFKALTVMDQLPPDILPEVYRGIAWNYYSEKKWEKAVAAYRDFLNQFPKSVFAPEAYLRQAESYYNSNSYSEARDRFQQLIDRYPLHPEALEARILMARINWVQEKYDAAKIMLEEALKYSSTGQQRQRIMSLQGDLARELGDHEAAAQYYRLAFTEDNKGPRAAATLLNQANSLYTLRRFEKSGEVYHEVVNRFPQSQEAVTAQYSIGLTYFQENRLDEYLDECRQTAAAHPGSNQGALALTGATEILIEQKRYDEAISAYDELISEFASVADIEQILFRKAQALSLKGDVDGAKQEFHHLLDYSPRGLYAADASLALGDFATQDHDFESALEWYSSVIETFPYHPRFDEALLKGAETARHLGQNETALQGLDRFFDEHSGSKFIFEAHLTAGKIFVADQETDSARTHLEIASTSPDRKIAAEALFWIAKNQLAAGAVSEALKNFMKVSYLYTDQRQIAVDSLNEAGNILKKQGKDVEANRLFDKAVRFSAEKYNESDKTADFDANAGGTQ